VGENGDRRPLPGKLLGILGGMGPLASAEFLHTFYRLNITEPEQEAPRCLLLSDPSIPDRTAAILAGDTRELVACIDKELAHLLAAGADRILIACVTAHAVLQEIPEPRRSRVIPLLDLVIDEVATSGRPHLLLATNGTRRARIFENHPRWSEAASLVRWTDEGDQQRLHHTAYRFKHTEPDEDALDWLARLPAKYGVDSLIFGCTELHLLQRLLAKRKAAGQEVPRVVDPLWIAARDVRKMLVASTRASLPPSEGPKRLHL
jgi:aspartate racemase